MRVLMLNDEETAFLQKVMHSWTSNCQESKLSEVSQSNHLSVLRKIGGRYSKAEIADLMEAAVKLLKR